MTDIDRYNKFCKGLKEGSVLYNLDHTNLWGEYLMVVNITKVKVGDYTTYTVLLLGLKKEEEKFVPSNLRISLNPDYVQSIPLLMPVGFCKFTLAPYLEKTNIDLGLVTIYSNTDLHRFTTKLNLKKSKVRKYDNGGNLVIKKSYNS